MLAYGNPCDRHIAHSRQCIGLEYSNLRSNVSCRSSFHICEYSKPGFRVAQDLSFHTIIFSQFVQILLQKLFTLKLDNIKPLAYIVYSYLFLGDGVQTDLNCVCTIHLTQSYLKFESCTLAKTPKVFCV